MALSIDTQQHLNALSEPHLVALCGAFGVVKRTKATAFAALATMEPAAVEEALEALEHALGDPLEDPPEDPAQQTNRPECEFTCESDLGFTYNRPYVLLAGVTVKLPLPVARHAEKVARNKHGGPCLFRTRRL